MSGFTAAPVCRSPGRPRRRREPEPLHESNESAKAGIPAWKPPGGSVLAGDVRRLLHLQEEVEVVLRLLHLVEEKLQRLLHLERMQDAAKLPQDVELLRRH